MSEQNLLRFLPSLPTSPLHAGLSVPWAWFQIDTQHPLALSHCLVWLGALTANQDRDTVDRMFVERGGCFSGCQAILGEPESVPRSEAHRRPGPSSELVEGTETPGRPGGQMPGRWRTSLPPHLHKHDCDRVVLEGPLGTLGGAD